MNDQFVVSLIIPVYQAANFIENAVKSAVDFKEVGELILIEDGSSDDSYSVCKELESKFEKVRLLTHYNRENRGAAFSRNLGISHALFPFISFLDADDVYYANRFEISLSLLLENPTIDACFGNVEIVYSSNGKSKIMGALSWDKKSSLLTYLLRGGYFHTNAVTIRKSFFYKIGSFDQSCWPHEDSELWIRMAALGRIEAIADSKPLSTYFIHDQNLSKKSVGKTKLHFWNVVLKNSKKLNFSFIQMILVYKQLIKAKFYG